MRIAIVSDAIYPYHKGGKETRWMEVSTRLAQMGHEVHIYTMKWWHGPELERVENGVHLHAISRQWPLYNGEKRSVLQGVLFSVACFRLLSEQFDVIDVDHMPGFPLFSIRLVAWLKRKPMIGTWHEVWGRDYWRQYMGWPGELAAVLEWLSAWMPDRIVAVSPQTAERLHSVLHTRRSVSVATNGIDLHKIQQAGKAQADTFDIVTVGRLIKHKNVDMLVRAVALLKLERPNLRVMVIGDGPERTALEQLAVKLGVSENVKFTGYVANDQEKFSLMKASRLCALPSTREGFGIAALEAMACGLPVVTVDHADNAARDLITPDNGRLCKPTAVSLAAAIASLLDAKPVRGGRQTARAHDWKRTLKVTTEVYAQ
jgi:glycosyltransferase involved in cell wall biosynthesis